MTILSSNDIDTEVAERILDKIHLAITKLDPDWMTTAMSPYSRGEDERYLNSLSRDALLRVLKSSGKTLDKDAKKKLSSEFDSLGAKFLAKYLKAWAKLDKIDSDKDEISEIRKSNFRLTEVPSNRKRIQGFEVIIENKKGSYRKGVTRDGRIWKSRLTHDYGYIRKSSSNSEKDHLDVYLGPDFESSVIFVVNQQNQNGEFEEHKALIGFHDETSAMIAYLSNYPNGWYGVKSIARFSVEEFKNWLGKCDHSTEIKDPKLAILKSSLTKIGRIRPAIEIDIRKSAQEIQELELSRPKKFPTREVNREEIPISKSFFSNFTSKAETLFEILKGRKPASLNSVSTWADGYTRKKTPEGWVIVNHKKKNRKEDLEKIVKNYRKKEPARAGGIRPPMEYPTKIPFNKIIRLNQYTDERNYDRETINTLKQSILSSGFSPSSPITVDRHGDKYAVVAGHHRHIAVEELIQEGKLPSNFPLDAVTREFANSNERLLAQMVENQRRNVLPTDEARGYGEMIEQGWDEKTIANRTGKPVGEIQKRLALNDLIPELHDLLSKKDKSLPLGVAEVIGMFGKDENGNINRTIQLRAFKWYVANRSKYPGRGASVVQNYISELKSFELENFDFDKVATASQKEALKTVSQESANSNRKFLSHVMGTIRGAIQRITGENINVPSSSVMKELGASIVLSGGRGVEGISVLAELDSIIRDITVFRDSLYSSVKEIEGNSETPLLFQDSSNVKNHKNEDTNRNGSVLAA